MKSSLRRPLGLPSVAVLLAAVACSGPDAGAGPAVPSPPERQAALCRALHKELPKTVGGLERRGAEPVSDLTAVWGGTHGEPEISLRCGVTKPALLKRNPATDSMDVNDVGWLPERQPDGSVRCTTVRREAWVEVTLPKKVVGEGGDLSALTDLSGAVLKTIPEGIIS
ncbi:DUF3515 domain-containing protein [Streptomyces cinnamoneus]|uniref:DUF3515 domain-containing protein n=1 Tax=Streptomyces sp. NPDC053079 TaxID=3365697 RepID=UPI000903E831